MKNTLTPTDKLSVAGRGEFQTSINDHGLRIQADATNTQSILQFTDQPVTIQWASIMATPTGGGDLIFNTNLTPQMIFTGAGKLGVGTITPNASAKLDVVSNTSGFAMPRMTSAQRKAIASPIDGLQVVDTDLKGIYIYFGTKWDCVSVPAGSVNYFANATAPNGYLECNGQTVSTTTYAELFAAIGYLYGGAGATFKLPDLRGEFIRGADNGRGVDVGRVIGTKQAGTIVNGDFDPSSTPSSMQSTAGSYQSLYGADAFDATAYNPLTTIASYSTASGTYSQSVGSFNFGITRPRNVAMMPCIKF